MFDVVIVILETIVFVRCPIWRPSRLDDVLFDEQNIVTEINHSNHRGLAHANL